MALQHLRSNTASKRPTPGSMSDGQLAINTNATSPGLFFKDAGGALIKVGPVHVGTSAPNSVPAGSSGNAIGEQWLDTSGGGYVFKIWDGTAWRSETGQFVDVAGDTMTGNLTISGADLIMSNGEIVAETGSAATPSITFTGDTNTGLYSPGADQVAISTNGTGRLFVDADGEVGIGTGSPDGLLTLAGANSDVPRFRIQHPSNDRDAAISTYFDGSGAYLLAGSNHYLNSSGSNTKFDATSGSAAWYLDGSGIGIFYNSSGSGAITERLRITSAGLVGIGTSSPDSNSKATIYDTGTAQKFNLLQLTNQGTSGNGDVVGVGFAAGETTQYGLKGSVGFVRTSSYGRGAIAFYTNNTAAVESVSSTDERMRIDSAGNVGIGTSSPGAKLEVNGGEIYNVNGTITQYLSTGGGAAVIGTFSNSDWSVRTNNVERCRVDTSGRLLVGTSSASGNLTIAAQGNSGATSGPAYLQLRRGALPSSTQSLGWIQFADNSSNVGAQIYAEASQNWTSGSAHGSSLVFSTTADGASSPTERLRITSAGNVGIGTSSPGSLFHARLPSTSTATIATFDRSDGAVASEIHYDGSDGRITFGTTTNHPLSFETNNTRAVTIDTSQRVGIGTTSPVDTLQINKNATNAASGGLTLKSADSDESFLSLGVSTSLGKACITSSENGSGTVLPIAFTVGSSSTDERMRIDSSGRLLVGTSTSVNTGTNVGASIQINSTCGLAVRRNSADAFPSNITLGKSRNATDGSYTIVNSSDGIGSIRFAADDGTDLLTQAASIEAYVDGTPGTDDMPGRLVFSTTADGASSPTERMRITSGGNVGIGKTPVVAFEVLKDQFNNYVGTFTNSSSSGPYGFEIAYSAAAPNNTSYQFFNCRDFSTTRAQIRSNGGLANFSANNANLSDRNAKKDITPAADTWDCIKEWEIVNYRYKDQPDDADLNLGVIAQQVAESCPEVITVFQEAKEATEDQPAQEERLGVKEQQMYWMAIKALQEAQVRIEALEAEVAALKAQ